MKPIQTTKLSLLALAAAFPCVVQAARVDVITTQTVTTTPYGVNVHAITSNTTWTKDNVYILTDKVFVTNGATLTIEPGTKIYSTFDDNATPGDKADDKFGSLVIIRGSKIMAQGTASEPIVFTTIDELEAADQEDLDGDGFIAAKPTETTAGRWGGLVVLGSAPIANFSSATTNIGEDRIEGFQPAASADIDGDGRADVIEYGGAVSADNSGVITYVSIRHGGYVYATNSEINGLTLGGVGSGTTINHVEVYANADDGVEFFGGTVNTSHMIMAFNQDDSFDIDQGYSGTNQFWFAVQAPYTADGTTSGHDNGGEWDGQTNTTAIQDHAANSAPVIYNATFIGSGTGAALGNDKGNNAIFLDDRFRGKVYNSVFDDYREHLIEATSDGKGAGLAFANNTIGRFGAGTPGSNLTYLNTSTLAADTFFNSSGTPINDNSNAGTNPQFGSLMRTKANGLIALNPLPASTSPLLAANGATTFAGAPTAATYRGAFGTTNWAAGWTKFDEEGYFATNIVDVVAAQTVTTTPYGVNVNAITSNTTWTKDKVYILKDKVFVTNGATLTIEPGTKIYSTFDDNATPGDKNDDKFGALVIVRGSKIMAQGTESEPIVFTTIDELEAETGKDFDGDKFVAEAPTETVYGRWGGLVVLGNAPVANFSSATTNIGEDRIEGFQPAASADVDGDGRADVIEYGGAVSADNSGVITYVSIRHGGYVYATNSEINGLTLGGVGSGTTIHHVEVYANADDGVEFFGGTVNTSHLVMAFNQDDSFDIDQGYSGTNQFWFAIQAPFASDGTTSGHDNGGEWDGQTNTTAIQDHAANSAPVIFNATFIGGGRSGLVGNDKGNNAIFLDDRFRGKVYNSVFDDYREHLIEATSDGKGAGLTFANNTIGRFGAGTPGSNLTYLNTSTLAADTFFNSSGTPINDNSNGGVNPQFTAYTRKSNNVLTAINPLPASTSPLLAANGATVFTTGIPVAATYRGAFGTENWAAGWTRLSTSGALLGSAPVSSGLADTDGDGISDVVEAANTAIGFNPAVSNGTPGTTFDGIFTEDAILDMTTTGQVMLQASGANVNLSLPVFKSTGLETWAPAGTLQLTMPKEGDKQFYRIQVGGAE